MDYRALILAILLTLLCACGGSSDSGNSSAPDSGDTNTEIDNSPDNSSEPSDPDPTTPEAPSEPTEPTTPIEPTEPTDPVTPPPAPATSCVDVAGDGPWKYDLQLWTSQDGTQFESAGTFQQCADVPSFGGNGQGTLIAAYQGFGDKSDDSRWDKIAVRISTDNGANWAPQQFIGLSGLPEGFSRPFDPTIVFVPGQGMWRLYFSLADNPQGMLNNNTCTHSATSTDGLQYTYESDTRFCGTDRPVIDPAVTIHKSLWHYTAPAGAPQDGAYHATSSDGLVFVETTRISSDNTHNWTGNLMSDGSNLYFYGTGANNPSGNPIWWSQSSDDGVTWSDFTATSIMSGKDPGVWRHSDGTWLLLVPTLR